MSHQHEWVEAARVFPDPGEELRKVEPARHPRTGEPFDWSDAGQVAFATEFGVEGIDVEPAPRVAKVIFDCGCGQTRHVPMLPDVAEQYVAMLASGEATSEDVGRLPVAELIEEVPAS